MHLRFVGTAAAALAIAVAATPLVHADPAPNWNGWYRITFHTDQKSGTSMAAGQPEEAYTVSYRFGTNCSSATCQAAALDGPGSKDNVEQSVKFDWTGTQWSHSSSWRWDCLLPDGTITFDPARSVTTYSPQPYGTLVGTFATNIGSGACQGTVYIPMTAVPAGSGIS
jgi:hypothetical protein